MKSINLIDTNIKFYRFRFIIYFLYLHYKNKRILNYSTNLHVIFKQINYE